MSMPRPVTPKDLFSDISANFITPTKPNGKCNASVLSTPGALRRQIVQDSQKENQIERQMRNLVREKHDLIKDVDARDCEIKKLNYKIHTVQKEKSQLAAEVASLKKIRIEYTRCIDILKFKVSTLENLADKKGTIYRELANARTDLMSKSYEIQDLTDEVHQHRKFNANYRRTIQQLQNSKTENAQTISILENKLNESRKIVNSLTRDLEDNDQKLCHLFNIITDFRSSTHFQGNADIKNRLDSLKSSLDDIKGSITSGIASLNSLEATELLPIRSPSSSKQIRIKEWVSEVADFKIKSATSSVTSTDDVFVSSKDEEDGLRDDYVLLNREYSFDMSSDLNKELQEIRRSYKYNVSNFTEHCSDLDQAFASVQISKPDESSQHADLNEQELYLLHDQQSSQKIISKLETQNEEIDNLNLKILHQENELETLRHLLNEKEISIEELIKDETLQQERTKDMLNSMSDSELDALKEAYRTGLQELENLVLNFSNFDLSSQLKEILDPVVPKELNPQNNALTSDFFDEIIRIFDQQQQDFDDQLASINDIIESHILRTKNEKEEFQQKISDFEAQVFILSKFLDEKNIKEKALTEELDNSADQISEFEENLQVKNEENRVLKLNLKNLKNEISQINKDVQNYINTQTKLVQEMELENLENKLKTETFIKAYADDETSIMSEVISTAFSDYVSSKSQDTEIINEKFDVIYKEVCNFEEQALNNYSKFFEDFYCERLQSLEKEIADDINSRSSALSQETLKWKELFLNLQAKIEPFKEQLDAFEMEKNFLLCENSETQDQYQKLSSQYAKLLGHQNHKQKIHYVEKLKDENLNMKKELATLREKNWKLTRENQKLKLDHKPPTEKRGNKENTLPKATGSESTLIENTEITDIL